MYMVGWFDFCCGVGWFWFVSFYVNLSKCSITALKECEPVITIFPLQKAEFSLLLRAENEKIWRKLELSSLSGMYSLISPSRLLSPPQSLGPLGTVPRSAYLNMVSASRTLSLLPFRISPKSWLWPFMTLKNQNARNRWETNSQNFLEPGMDWDQCPGPAAAEAATGLQRFKKKLPN